MGTLENAGLIDELLGWLQNPRHPPFRFEVLGEPVGEPRAQPTRSGGRLRMHRNSVADEWKHAVRAGALRALELEAPPREPVFAEHVPVVAVMLFRIQRPITHWANYTEEGLSGRAPAHPVGAPDTDNLAKAVQDALGGWPKGADPICWFNDAQVVALLARKVYCSHQSKPGASITIYRVD